MRPLAGYASVGADQVAYYVYGDGPVDVLFDTGFWGSFDVEWEEPSVRLFYEQIAGFARLIRFDRRGVGASDPIPLDAVPPWEAFAAEIDAVLDAAGSERAALVASASAGAPGMFYAATRPERLVALVVFMGTARYLEDDDYPAGVSVEYAKHVAAQFEEWGSSAQTELFLPSRVSDAAFQEWNVRMQRAISSPKATRRYFEADWMTDARAVLPSVGVPTLILHRTDNTYITLDQGRYLAEHIPDARLVELPGGDVGPFWEFPEITIEAIKDFVAGVRPGIPPSRRLATVMFTDIVESTRQAEELGDRRWRELLEVHDDLSARSIARNGGTLVKTTGDGTLATFDGPGRAIAAASDMGTLLERAGVQIRTGIHTGEIEVRGNDVGGVAVHIASRIMSLAGAEEIIVSNTVKDLVIGSDHAFTDRGTHGLKGLQGQYQLYAVETKGQSEETKPSEASR